MESNKHYRGGQRKSVSYRGYYVDGSAAKKVAAQPERVTTTPKRQTRPQHGPARTVKHQTSVQNRKHAEKQKRVNQTIAMRNREKAFKLDWKYTLFLCVAVIAVLGSCVVYLTTQSAVTQKNQEVTSLKTELSLLTDTNSATRERINDAIDLEYVREYATEVLGMVYPSESQIVYYQSTDDDYVKQYQDIPQSGN